MIVDLIARDFFSFFSAYEKPETLRIRIAFQRYFILENTDIVRIADVQCGIGGKLGAVKPKAVPFFGAVGANESRSADRRVVVQSACKIGDDVAFVAEHAPKLFMPVTKRVFGFVISFIPRLRAKRFRWRRKNGKPVIRMVGAG